MLDDLKGLCGSLTLLVSGCIGMLCWNLITCCNGEILKYVVSIKRVMLFNDETAAKVSWLRRKLNTQNDGRMIAWWCSVQRCRWYKRINMRCHAIAIINTRWHNNTDKLFFVFFYGAVSMAHCGILWYDDQCVLNWRTFGRKWLWDIGILFHFFLEGMGKTMIKRQNSLFSDWDLNLAHSE